MILTPEFPFVSFVSFCTSSEPRPTSPPPDSKPAASTGDWSESSPVSDGNLVTASYAVLPGPSDSYSQNSRGSSDSFPFSPILDVDVSSYNPEAIPPSFHAENVSFSSLNDSSPYSTILESDEIPPSSLHSVTPSSLPSASSSPLLTSASASSPSPSPSPYLSFASSNLSQLSSSSPR